MKDLSPSEQEEAFLDNWYGSKEKNEAESNVFTIAAHRSQILSSKNPAVLND